MGQSERRVHIIWHDTPPSPVRLASWRWLWTRLLEQREPCQETAQPQDPVGPEVATVATVGSGQTLWSGQPNDTRIDPRSK